MPSIDPDLVEQFSGQRRLLTVEAANAELTPLQNALERSRTNHAKICAQQSQFAREYMHANQRLKFASLPSKFGVEGWIFVLIISSLLAIAAAVGALFLCNSGMAWAFLIIATPYVTGFSLLPRLFPRDLAPLSAHVSYCLRQCEIVRLDQKATEAAFVRATAQYNRVKSIYDGIIRARDFPLTRLLNANFGVMSGSDFEYFLAEVFRFRGYTVQTTGKTGDQGVDLIISLGSERIAIQAKCYTNSVGNYAVQEVYTGMRIHGCHRCAVITSCTFTSGAIVAARHVGCLLITGNQIRDLIYGRIVL